jgi:hypothetical protein
MQQEMQLQSDDSRSGWVRMKLQSWVLVGLLISADGRVALFLLMGMGRLGGARAQAQETTSGRVPTIEEYQPKSTLITAEHKVERVKYPFVDIHSTGCAVPSAG